MSEQDGGRDQEIPGFQDATDGHREVSESEIQAHEEALPRHGERDFETDVEELHRPIFREPRDPIEGREPTPWWVWVITAIALFWGGWYLGRHGGTFGSETHVAFGEAEQYVRDQAQATQAGAVGDPVEAGRAIYVSRCQVCHQQTGRGVPGVFPPLIGSEWVVESPALPILIVLHGLQGPITVAGQNYNGAMPAWGDVLSDAEIAAVVTYIRQLAPNSAPPVSAGLVARLREATRARRAPWTAAELSEAANSPEIRNAIEAEGAAGPGEAGT